jgi:MoxR-like ATPase
MNFLEWSKVKEAAENIFWEYYHENFPELFCDYEWQWIDETDLEWSGEKGLEWIKEAWEILKAAGLTSYFSKTGYCQVVITFLALLGFYIESCGFALRWDLEYDYLEWAEKLDVSAYHIKELKENAFGKILDKNEADDEDILDSMELCNLVEHTHKRVVEVLTNSFGNKFQLSLSIWQTTQPDILEYPEYRLYGEKYHFYQVEDNCYNNLKTIDDATTVLNKLEKFFSGKIINLEENNITIEAHTIMSNNLDPNCPFSSRTFELLNLENRFFSYDFPQDYTDFNRFLAEPFQQLFCQIESQISTSIFEYLKLHNITINITICFASDMDKYNSQLFLDKNLGFQQNKDIISPLVIKMDSNHLEFGIYIDDKINLNYSSLFKVNLRENKQELRKFFIELKDEYNFICRSYSKNKEDDFSWTTFFNEVIHTDIYFVAINLAKDEVLQYSSEKLCGYITQTFERLFPLVLLATSDNPMPAIRKYLNLPKPEYSLNDCVDNIGIEKAKLDRWLRTIERKRQVIFSGSPGTGKTFIAEQIARFLTNDNNEQWELVQFHPAYSYEDFIQGIRPQTENGVLTYPLVPGRFLEFCQKAESCQGLCVLIIDEINRANLAQVFGELMYLLEYRDKKIRLAGNREQFSIPKNVRIIGTMNTADRSIALVDHALRRRFAFIELRPNYQVLRRYHEKHKTDFPIEKLIQEITALNRAIADKHYELGISFFLTENLDKHIADIWQMEIEPYLEEYFFDQPDKVEEFRWQRIESKIMS